MPDEIFIKSAGRAVEHRVDWASLVRRCMENFPEKVHYRVGDNVSACIQGGDRTITQNWGEYLTDDKTLVGCQFCKEWLHA